MTHTAVMIMAKAPYPGQVKTRLCPPLTPWQAAALGRAFLCDKIAQVRTLTSARPAIAYAPASGADFFVDVAPDFTRIAQQGPGLGERLIHSLEYFLNLGYAGVMAIDSDTPTLPTHYLQQAVALLTKPDVDVVIGPSDDGGYYLIGLRAMHHALFIDMPWSTSAVLPETVRRAEALKLRVAWLPAWFDVDTPADLARLRTMLSEIASEEPRHTRQFFLEHT
jgi:rSAM/selenodomain-associated transferase 1